MKMKVILASAALVAITFVAFAFNKLTSGEYYYKPGTAFQRLEDGHTTESDLKERTITSGAFQNVNNWTTTIQAINPISDMSKYIGMIRFDEEATADGGSDGQLTLQEALTALYNDYNTNSPRVMQQIITVGSASIYVTANNEAR
jgi:hypothetical protein